MARYMSGLKKSFQKGVDGKNDGVFMRIKRNTDSIILYVSIVLYYIIYILFSVFYFVWDFFVD